MKNLQLVVLILIAFASYFFTSCSNNPTSKKVIYLVRHAEKNLADTTDNPALTIEGLERSFLLVKTLGSVKIDEFHSTKYQRNMNTLRPLAKENNKKIKSYEWHDWKLMLEDIKKGEQQKVIICGHGDNLLPMISYLGGLKPMEKLGHHEYDNIFKLTVSTDTTLVEVIKY